MATRGYIDLHMHTTASDGVCSVGELIAEARRARLRAIAITDHDTIDSLDEARRQLADLDIELVSGVELSTYADGASVHVLGYLFDDAASALGEQLREQQHARVGRAEKMVTKLQRLGVAVTFDRVLAIAGEGAVGRPHVAEAILETGAVSTFQEAFQRYIGARRPAYVARETVTPRQAIEWVHAAGGVTSLAHPGTLRRDDLIADFAAAGLDAIEVWHPRHGPETVARYQDLARELGLATTGGSDFHGGGRGDARIGDQPVPMDVLDELRARAH